MHYTEPMKSTTIPSVRVAPHVRADIESLLQEGESLSQFVESSVMDAVRRRRNQAEFVARGLASLAQSKQTGDYVESDAVLATLERKLAAVRVRQAKAVA